MSPNDSDSSNLEEGDYTETNVLLGYATQEPTEDTISHLGGQSTWVDPVHPPSAALAQCKVCHNMMRLLLQLNGDLPERFPGHERRLYIFACPRRTCNHKDGSIRALRGTRVDRKIVERGKPTDHQQKEEQGKVEGKTKKRETTPLQRRDIGADLFRSKTATSIIASAAANPFSTSSNEVSNPTPPQPNPFGPSLPSTSTLAAKPPQKPVSSSSSDLPTTFASALSLNNNNQQQHPPTPKASPPPPKYIHWPSADTLPSPYPKYYLDAEYETLEEQPPSLPHAQTHPSINANEYEDQAADKNTSVTKESSTYESTHDKTFQSFADRLSQNPEQVLRYEFGGTPLLYSRTDEVGKRVSSSHRSGEQQQHSSAPGMLPRCTNCGAERVFELQLTPHVITVLESDDEEEVGLEGMEWGTVLLGVCERDCLPRLGDEGGQGREGDGMKVGYVEEWVGVQWEERREGGR